MRSEEAGTSRAEPDSNPAQAFFYIVFSRRLPQRFMNDAFQG